MIQYADFCFVSYLYLLKKLAHSKCASEKSTETKKQK